jgi:hypothetical protein
VNQPFEDFVPYEQYHTVPKYDSCWSLMMRPKHDAQRFCPYELTAGMWKDDGSLYITE